MLPFLCIVGGRPCVFPEKEKKMDKKYWIWLSRIEGLGAIKINELLNRYKTPETIWNLDEEELKNTHGIGEELSKKITDLKYKENLDRYIEYMEKNKIEIITIKDKEYPSKLKNIYDAPAILYVKGNKEVLDKESIAIVGCRDCSFYGRCVAEKIAYELSKNNIVTISGLAKGIDSFAHKGSIRAKEKTIAVLGNGLDIIYPQENQNLYNEIIYYGGAIISEYIVGTKPERMNFPARNRIVSGLSSGIVVVEAKEKSGTLITVDFGLEQGKNIFAVPGNITSQNSIGTNKLIKEGAKCVTCIQDILEEM